MTSIRTIPIRHYDATGCRCIGPQNADILCPCEREQRNAINQTADRRRITHETDPTFIALRTVNGIEQEFSLGL